MGAPPPTVGNPPSGAADRIESELKSRQCRRSHLLLDSVEQSYTSLVQQYLSILCHDNATFLAERMVAYRPTAHAVYLLAMCHYRGGSPKRCRSVLLQHQHRFSISEELCFGSNDRNLDEKGDTINNKVIAAASTFLLAKACIDLQLYSEAESVLLRQARDSYRTMLQSNPSELVVDMDQWILNTSPCPVPNGAAGLALLGLICQKSQRRKRAAQYYRMSLKLDPMMWTSYEVLCEMGASDSDVDDPVSVFGVVPPALLKIRREKGGYAQDEEITDCDNQNKPADTSEEKEPQYHDMLQMSSPAFSMSGTPGNVSISDATAHPQRRPNAGKESVPRGYTIPSTPFPGQRGSTTIDIDKVDCNGNRYFEGGQHEDDRGSGAPYINRSQLPASSLFKTGGSYRHSTLRTNANNPSLPGLPPKDNQRYNVPPAALFNTPDLTPIQCKGELHNSMNFHFHPGGQHNFATARFNDESVNATGRYQAAIASTVAGTGHNTASSKDILTRARHIASRLYYEPSPETTPPYVSNLQNGLPFESASSSMKIYRNHCPLGGSSYLKHLNEVGKSLNMDQSRLSFFCASSVTTPAAASVQDTALNADNTLISSNEIAEKRVLFRQSVASTSSDAVAPSAEVKISNANFTSERNVYVPGTTLGLAVEGDFYSQVPDNRDGFISTDYVSNLILECGTQEDGGVHEILSLLCTLGAAQRMLCQYRSQDALLIYHTLPHSQFHTGWVQHQIGRAYFETADYQNAQRALEAMQRIEPYRMKGLEVLSTILWHLKKEVDLSHLAQRAVDFDWNSPESWCVVGNCFSLQKEHETALTFFRRSIQLDPGFTYSHTLSGHEYVSNEDFDKAVACFRDAIRADERHYNAWYGLGAIYFRQEKYDMAEYHFSRALAINPQSSVLHCHLGMAQHANGKPYEALDTLTGAFRLDPRNPQARYRRATIWMSMDRPHEALVELEKVRDAAPREASVHFAMGRVLKRLGRPEQAMRCFLIALDLDPKDNNLIKTAMDRLDEPDIEEDVLAF